MSAYEALPDNRVFVTTTGIDKPGLAVAIKDNFDQKGFVTGAGSKARQNHLSPATEDADCLEGLNQAVSEGTAHIVGRTVLDEFAAGATGINPWTGAAPNPIDPDRIAGGSSSGSAIAVATSACDIGIGSDTGGSVRIPAACCGVAALKTTRGRISVRGVHPLSQTLDTVGPIARDVAGLLRGMQLLEPSFEGGLASDDVKLGRVHLGLADEGIEATIDHALDASGYRTEKAALESWSDCHNAAYTILMSEAWENNAEMITQWPDEVGEDRKAEITAGSQYTAEEVAAARDFQTKWEAEVLGALEQVDVLCLPTIGTLPPKVVDAANIEWSRFSLTMPFNLAGVPALSLPLKRHNEYPVGLQLVAKHGEESLLLAVAAKIEQKWATLSQ